MTPTDTRKRDALAEEWFELLDEYTGSKRHAILSYQAGYDAGLAECAGEIERLKNWKMEMEAVTKPVLEFEHNEMQLGESRVTFLLRLAKERDAALFEVERLNAELNQWRASTASRTQELQEIADAMNSMSAWREQAVALAKALGKIAFSRGTDAGSVNAKNYDTAAEALAEFAAWEASRKDGRSE
jgi:predicted  nucleic acid-binding Zn-ribbon protein